MFSETLDKFNFEEAEKMRNLYGDKAEAKVIEFIENGKAVWTPTAPLERVLEILQSEVK